MGRQARRGVAGDNRRFTKMAGLMEGLESRLFLTTVTSVVTYIQLDASGSNIDIYAGSTPTGTPTVIPLQGASPISVTPATGNDRLIIDYSNGDPVPVGGISFTGGGSSLGNTLEVIGASPADAFTLGSGQVQHGTGTVTFSNALNLTVTTGTATATADLHLLNVNVGAQASLTATTSEHIGQFLVSTGGTASLHGLIGASIINGSLQFVADGTNAGTNSLNNLLIAGSPDNWSGSLDLTNNKMVVETTAQNKAAMLTRLQNQVTYGTTHSAGIFSSNLPAGTVLAVIDGATTGLGSFGGITIDANSILIAPELAGDANLDGVVNQADLSTVLNNFGSTTAGWTGGNFDGSATVDLTDMAAVLNNMGKTFASPTGISAAVGTATGTQTATQTTTATTKGTSRKKKHAPVEHKRPALQGVVWQKGALAMAKNTPALELVSARG